MGRKGGQKKVLPGQGRGHAMMESTRYVSSGEDQSSGSFHSTGLTGAAFQDAGSYEIYHSAGGGGGLAFGSGGQVRVQIDNAHHTFHRDDIVEHKRPGYYTVRLNGKKYNIKYNQFELHEDVQVVQQRVRSPSGHSAHSAGTSHVVQSAPSGGIINFFPYYKVQMGSRWVTVPYSALASGKLRGGSFKFLYNGVKTHVKCRKVQPVRSMYKCIVNGKMTEIPFTDIQPAGDNMYSVT
jgi:hypothetical protein